MTTNYPAIDFAVFGMLCAALIAASAALALLGFVVGWFLAKLF